MEDDEFDVAIHEAGHAVAHVRLELEHDGADIVRADGRLGAARGEGIEHVFDRSGAERVTLALCAGYGAMVAAGYNDDQARAGTDGGAKSDFELARELIEKWLLPGLDEWLVRAVDLMRAPENVAAVALVAKHLSQHERLDGDYVDVLVELADGNATEAEFARYLALRKLQ